MRVQGEARGGLVEVTRKKEAELKKREEELERRWAHFLILISFCRMPCSSRADTFPYILPSKCL